MHVEEELDKMIDRCGKAKALCNKVTTLPRELRELVYSYIDTWYGDMVIAKRVYNAYASPVVTSDAIEKNLIAYFWGNPWYAKPKIVGLHFAVDMVEKSYSDSNFVAPHIDMLESFLTEERWKDVGMIDPKAAVRALSIRIVPSDHVDEDGTQIKVLKALDLLNELTRYGVQVTLDLRSCDKGHLTQS